MIGVRPAQSCLPGLPPGACPAAVYKRSLFKITVFIQSLSSLVSPVSLSGRNLSRGLGLGLQLWPRSCSQASSLFSATACEPYHPAPCFLSGPGCPGKEPVLCSLFVVLWGRKGVVWASDKRLMSPLLFTKAAPSWTKPLTLPVAKTSTVKGVTVFNFI